MARRDILARYTETLDATGEAMARHPAGVVALAERPQPSLVHRQVVELLDELLSLIGPADGMTGKLLKSLRRMEPHLMDDFSTVNEAALIEFMHRLGGRMLAVGTEGTQPALVAGATGGPGPNLAPR
ncbi:MAG TPA: hypothetical protein VGH66_01425 [Acidimicrobiales bacterium]